MRSREESPRETCSECAHFVDDPLELERSFPGVTALSSTYGSTRGSCGICVLRDTFQDPIPACDDFLPRRDAAAAASRRVDQNLKM